MFPLNHLHMKALQYSFPLPNDLLSYIEEIFNTEAKCKQREEFCSRLKSKFEIYFRYDTGAPDLVGEWEYGLEDYYGPDYAPNYGPDYHSKEINMFCRMAMEALLPKEWQSHVFFKDNEINHVNHKFSQYDLERSAKSREYLDLHDFFFKWTTHDIPALALDVPVHRIVELKRYLHNTPIHLLRAESLSSELLFRRCYMCKNTKNYNAYKPPGAGKGSWASQQPTCKKCLNDSRCDSR